MHDHDVLGPVCVAIVIAVLVLGRRGRSTGSDFVPVSDRAQPDAPERGPVDVPYLTVPELWSPHLRVVEELLKVIWRNEVLAATTTERKAAGISKFARRAATSSPLQAAPELAAMFEALHIRLDASLNGEREMTLSELRSAAEEASRLFNLLKAVARKTPQADPVSLPLRSDDPG